MKPAILLFSLLSIVFRYQAMGQEYREPQTLRAKGTFSHRKTKTGFPEQMEAFTRREIIAYDNRKKDIEVTYALDGTEGKTSFSVFVFPAGKGEEGRLRNAYKKSVLRFSLGARDSVSYAQHYDASTGDGYKVNGFTAISNENPKRLLSLFECGKWFFKIQITSDHLDSAAIESLKEKILTLWKPVHLVKSFPLQLRQGINVSRAAARDTLMLGSTTGAALVKLGWAKKNVDSLERLAGFPDLYLEMHVEALKQFAAFDKRKKFSKVQPQTRKEVDYITLLLETGFAEEFLMDQYYNIMIVPKNVTLDLLNYYEWKKTHPSPIDPDEFYYQVFYTDD